MRLYVSRQRILSRTYRMRGSWGHSEILGSLTQALSCLSCTFFDIERRGVACFCRWTSCSIFCSCICARRSCSAFLWVRACISFSMDCIIAAMPGGGASTGSPVDPSTGSVDVVSSGSPGEVLGRASPASSSKGSPGVVANGSALSYIFVL